MSSSSRSLPFVVDPLAWLSSSLSCEQFLEQAQVRYAVFGAYENFPEEKQKEIRIVLATGCEEKFEACNFPMCPLTQRSVSDAVDLLLGNVASSSSEIPPAISSPAPTSAIASAAESVATSAEASSPAPSVEEEEWKSYRSLVERVKKERRELIAAAEKREKEQGLVWKRFIIPEDVQEEREEVVRESKADSTKTSAVNNAASPNTGRSTSPSGASGASQTSNEKPLRGPSERLPGAQPDSSSENGGLFDQDANNLQIGILPPLPPSPPVDPHRRK